VIGSLRGRLVDRGTTGEVLIEVAGTGIGYRAQLGPAAAFELGDVGDEVFVWVHHHIRDDTQSLYGFVDRAQRDTFETLLGAHGVGPALALAILSVHAPAALARIVADDDTAGLCLVPGVGKKTAARLLIELKSRLLPGGEAAGVTSEGGDTGMLTDVHAALEGLGYRGEEISGALATETVRDAPDVAEALRRALRELGQAR
jgi:Holliday junction DNA helicase RuvA